MTTMTKGKYASSAQARLAREEAIRAAANARKEAVIMADRLTSVETENGQLRNDLAALTTSELTAARTRIAKLEDELHSARDLLARARVAMRDNYEKSARAFTTLVPMFPFETILDRLDSVTTFFVVDELLSADEVEVDWVNARVRNVRKRASHRRAAAASVPAKIDERKAKAHYDRREQVAE